MSQTKSLVPASHGQENHLQTHRSSEKWHASNRDVSLRSIYKACGRKSCGDPDGGKRKGMRSRQIESQGFGQETRWKKTTHGRPDESDGQRRGHGDGKVTLAGGKLEEMGDHYKRFIHSLGMSVCHG